MTRKSDSASSDRPASSKDLKAFRVQIDKLDQHILKLINERAGLAAKIGRVKSETNDSVFSPAREEEVIANVLSANKGPLPEVTVRAIYREIISGAPSPELVERHRLDLQWALRSARLYQRLTCAEDFPDRSLAELLEVKRRQLEEHWKYIYEPPSKEESEKLQKMIQRAFPDESRA